MQLSRFHDVFKVIEYVHDFAVGTIVDGRNSRKDDAKEHSSDYCFLDQLQEAHSPPEQSKTLKYQKATIYETFQLDIVTPFHLQRAVKGATVHHSTANYRPILFLFFPQTGIMLHRPRVLPLTYEMCS